MDGMDGVGQLQRRHVVKMLMDVLKKYYPREHDYLLLRSKQYESMCYTRASTVRHYYHLVNEGFRKIRTAHGDQSPAAPNSALAASSGQQVNAGIQVAQTSLVAASQNVSCAPTMVHQASKTTTDRMYNFANESNCINSTNPPNPAGSALPVNPPNKGIYKTNLPVHAHHDPTSQQVNQMQSIKQSYIAKTMSQPLSAGNVQLTRFSDPTLHGMNPTSVPPASNSPIHPMFKPAGNPVVAPDNIPSVNRISSRMTVNPAIHPFFNSSVNPGASKVIDRINNETSPRIINQMENTNQPAPQNPRPMVNHVAVTAVSPAGLSKRKAHHMAAPIQTPGHEAKKGQPHSNEVDQFLLSMGMIPESMVSAPTNNVNRTRMPIGDSNQVTTIPSQPITLPSGMRSAQNPNGDSRKKSVLVRVPTSRADSASSQPRNESRNAHRELFSQFSQFPRPVSTSIIGTKRARPREEEVQISRAKKRNSSTARINTKETSSSSPQHGNLQSASIHVFNRARTGPAKPSHQQNPLQAMENTQHMPDGQKVRSTNLGKQLSLCDPSMKERILISDSIHVSVGQVCTAAASCGYKLTAEQIKSLSKEQVLRFFIRARQMALKEACNLLRGENGQVNVSKQQLDTLGVEYETNESKVEQTGNAKANLDSVQNSSTPMAQRDSLPANIEMGAIHMMPPTHNLQSKTYQTNKASQSAPKFIPRNSAQELHNNRDSGKDGRSDGEMPRADVSKAPVSTVAQGTEQVVESQNRRTTSEAPVVSSKGGRPDTGRGSGNLLGTSLNLPEKAKEWSKNKITASCAQATQARPTDTQTIRNVETVLTSRLTLFQKKYGVYRNLINQTLHFLISLGHEGQKQVLYMRYSLQLLTEPAALGPKLTTSLLNTTENFLRDFLVRYQGIPMKTQRKQNNRTYATKQKGSPAVNNEKKSDSSNAEISATKQAHVPGNAEDDKVVTTQSTTREANLQAIAGAKADQPNLTIRQQDPEPRQNGALVTPSAQMPVPPKPISDQGTQNKTAADTAVTDENLQSVIAQKLNRVNHYVHRALHVAEMCEKGLEQESMLHFKEERLSEVCHLLQYDAIKKAREMKEQEKDAGPSERSLLEMIKEECDGAYKKNKKLMINIKEKWNKPVVECLLAYQSIRLPKIVIHVGGTYRKDLSASFGFERPPFGWVPVLTDIKKRFKELVDEKDSVSTILEAWASAAQEVLGDDNVHNE